MNHVAREIEDNNGRTARQDAMNLLKTHVRSDNMPVYLHAVAKKQYGEDAAVLNVNSVMYNIIKGYGIGLNNETRMNLLKTS